MISKDTNRGIPISVILKPALEAEGIKPNFTENKKRLNEAVISDFNAKRNAIEDPKQRSLREVVNSETAPLENVTATIAPDSTYVSVYDKYDFTKDKNH